MFKYIALLTSLLSANVFATTGNDVVVNQQKQESVKSNLITTNQSNPSLANRWLFDPLNSNEHKFVFKLNADENTYLGLSCDRKTDTMRMKVVKDGVTYRSPKFDSVTAYTPNDTLRDSIIILGGPTIEKVIQFFDDTSEYYIILDHHILGKFTVGAKASGDLASSVEVCKGLTFRQ